MGRIGISLECKLATVEKYKRGKGNQDSIAREYGVHKRSFQQWLSNYEAMGPSGLAKEKKNGMYSTELKTSAVEAYLRGEGSKMEICKRYSIRSRKQLLDGFHYFVCLLDRALFRIPAVILIERIRVGLLKLYVLQCHKVVHECLVRLVFALLQRFQNVQAEGGGTICVPVFLKLYEYAGIRLF